MFFIKNFLLSVKINIFRFALNYWRKWFQKKPVAELKHDIKLVRSARGQDFPSTKQVKHLTKILSWREKVLLRFALSGLFVGVVWLLILGVSNYLVHVPTIGGRYVEAMVGSPKLVNPIFSSLNDVDMDLTRLIFSGLMRVDDKQRIVPDLAVNYSLSEDKKTYTFQLRQDVVWHDGEKFTAHDVLFTFETIQNSAVGSPLAVGFQGIKIEAPDDYTVKFTLVEQLANVGSEVVRAINWKKKNNLQYSCLAFERALELLSLSIDDKKNKKRLKELTRLYEVLVDYFYADNIYDSSEKSWLNYFNAFNYAARI